MWKTQVCLLWLITFQRPNPTDVARPGMRLPYLIRDRRQQSDTELHEAATALLEGVEALLVQTIPSRARLLDKA
ncbi:hypothetical protein SD72_13875 [Leucobacter komagatae]|uniref:Uncharacterized protein n=1 Tax=Leucobacter komagatae TaxID=55969 RepID=A0A0D0HVQ4_9MICO|nr:hypothetical protein SD72_13875 [Leucobacter komagatae]